MIALLAQAGADLGHIADSVARIDHQVSKPPTLDDELRALATFASIALALLALFTTRRTERLRSDKASPGLKKFVNGGWKPSVPDIALALATAAALATMLPALLDSVDLARWFARDHTLESMFSLVYVGFAGVLAWQLANLWQRVTGG